MPGKLYPFTTQPGIKRDGTSFASQYYTDGRWVRFQRGLPRKMGGYSQLISYPDNPAPNVGLNTGTPRGLFVFPISANSNVYIGDQYGLNFFTMDQEGNVYNPTAPLTSITPVGFIPQDDYLWQFDVMFSTTDDNQLLLAHPGRNLLDINSDAETPIYYTPVNSTDSMLPIGQSVSGGICVFHPFLFIFGNNGSVAWSDVNNPFNFDTGGSSQAGSARICSDKIVYGLQTRGGNSSPAGLLWSLSTLNRVTFVGGPEVFRFDTVTDQSSILTSRSVIEYEGVWIWAGINQFLMYNGSVTAIPNQMSTNFFFDNLNYAEREKIWVTKEPHFGEIWFHFPMGDSTECNHALIYNIKENSWYDTPIERGCGYFAQVFKSPVWADNTASNDAFSIWRHETGVDQNIDGVLTAIPSYIESGDISWCAVGPTGQWTGTERVVDLYRFEPDMIQSGDLNLIVKGRAYARSPVISSDPYVISPDTLKIDLREQRREMTLRFESNVVGGDYQFGQHLLYLRLGDVRP